VAGEDFVVGDVSKEVPHGLIFFYLRYCACA
jgi:hypothetical protein